RSASPLPPPMRITRLRAPPGTLNVYRLSLPDAPERPGTGTPFCRPPSPGPGSGPGSASPPPPPSKRAQSNRLGGRAGAPSTPVVALAMIAFSTWAGVAPGLLARYRAATPATCGAAIEVPLMVLGAVLLVCQAEVI